MTGRYMDALEERLAVAPDRRRRREEEEEATPVVYTAMHGVGADYVDAAFRRAGFRPLIHVEEQRGKKDGGIMAVVVVIIIESFDVSLRADFYIFLKNVIFIY